MGRSPHRGANGFRGYAERRRGARSKVSRTIWDVMAADAHGGRPTRPDTVRARARRVCRAPRGARLVVIPISTDKKRSSRAQPRFENFIPFLLPLCPRLVAKHRRVIDARHVHRPQNVPPPPHSSHHPSWPPAAARGPRGGRRFQPAGVNQRAASDRDRRGRSVSASCSTPRSPFSNLSSSFVVIIATSLRITASAERARGRIPRLDRSRRRRRDRRTGSDQPAFADSGVDHRIRHRRTASAAWSAIVPSRANLVARRWTSRSPLPARARASRTAVCDESAGGRHVAVIPKPCHLCARVVRR